MEKTTDLTQLTDLQKAQQLIDAENKKQLEAAESVFKEAVDKIEAMGFVLDIAGEFKGSQIKTVIILNKK